MTDGGFSSRILRTIFLLATLFHLQASELIEDVCELFPEELQQVCDSSAEGIPYDCTELPVIVVGAGISGATAAYELHQRGCLVKVLEAADIAGGRTRVIDGTPFPFIWIHGTENNPITSALIRFGFEDHIRFVGGDSSSPGGENVVWFTQDKDGSLEFVKDKVVDQISELTDRYFTLLERDIETYFFQTKLNDPTPNTQKDVSLLLGENIGRRLSRFFKRLSRKETHLVESGLRSYYDDDSGLPREQNSFYHSTEWWMNDYGYGDFPNGTFSEDSKVGCAPDTQELFMCGYSGLVHTLLDGIDVELNQPVSKIERSPTGVRVGTVHGNVYEGSQVVFAAPLGVLKEDEVMFDPPLPKRIVESISRLGMGTLSFFYIEFPEQSWDPDQYAYSYLPPTGEFSPVTSIFNLSPWLPEGYDPTLMVTYDTNTYYDRQASGLSDEDIYQQDIRPILQLIFPKRPLFRNPTKISSAIGGWDTPYVHGAYSHLRPGSSPEDFQAFVDPVPSPDNAKLFFCGEHTHSIAWQSTTGAYVSGVRAARDCLAYNAVNLGAVGVSEMPEDYYQEVTMGLNDWEWQCGPSADVLDDDYYFDPNGQNVFPFAAEGEQCVQVNDRRRWLGVKRRILSHKDHPITVGGNPGSRGPKNRRLHQFRRKLQEKMRRQEQEE